jgi:hypothetical protein
MPTARSTPVVPTSSSMTAVAAPSPPQRDGNPTANPIRALQGFGQSVWLDYLRRSLFTSGEFRRLIVEDGLRGATSNLLQRATGGDSSIAGCLRAHINRLRPGDYFGILAYLEMNQAHTDILQMMRHAVRDRRCVATCLEFGPRFLHSTGQAYKGGPNTGLFLQITCDDVMDLPVPGRKYSFGVAKAAAARGDFSVLVERQRRVLHVHLGADVDGGLTVLRSALVTAVGG